MYKVFFMDILGHVLSARLRVAAYPFNPNPLAIGKLVAHELGRCLAPSSLSTRPSLELGGYPSASWRAAPSLQECLPSPQLRPNSGATPPTEPAAVPSRG